MTIALCTRQYRCDCAASGPTTSVYGKTLEEAKAECDKREYIDPGGTGSGDCWVH